MAKISQMDPTEASSRMYSMYMDAVKNYDPEKHGAHPSQAFQRWADIAATGGANSEEPIQSQDDMQEEEGLIENDGFIGIGAQGGVSGNGAIGIKTSKDNSGPPATRGTNKPGGKPVGQDGRFEISAMDGVPRFYSGNAVLVGDAALAAHARQGSPQRASTMADAIKGYRRK